MFKRIIVGIAAAAFAVSAFAEKVRIACVGDSITFGDKVTHREQCSYPAVLQKLLGVDFEVQNFGVCGASVSKDAWYPYWKVRAFAPSHEFLPNVVIIMLGTNDTNPKNWPRTQKSIERDFNALIDSYATLSTKPKIYLCLPVECFGSKFASEECLQIIRPIILKVAKKRGIIVIDTYAALKGKKELFPDNLHPANEGAKIIAQTVYSAIAPEFKK